MEKKIKISDKEIGQNNPTLIIAEAGVNHNGSIRLAKRLIDIAAQSGADVIKFQTYHTKDLILKNTEKVYYQNNASNKNESQYDMLKRLELSDKEFIELAKYSKKRKIIFLSSPFDKASVDLLERLNVPAYKIASGEITNFPLIAYIVSKKKPIILSTGMSKLQEIKDAIVKINQKGQRQIILMHCVSNYPAPIDSLNLRIIPSLRKKFKLPIGFSDHSLSTIIPVIAVSLGACIIEKHFTINRDLEGPDHRSSLEPQELKLMISNIRDAEKALGFANKKINSTENEIKRIVRKSIVAAIDIKKGVKLSLKMLDFKRPGTGISPKAVYKIIGKRMKRDVKKGQLFLWEML